MNTPALETERLILRKFTAEDMEEHHDFDYALRKEFWHKGIAAEAGRAVVGQYSKRLGMERANAACWFCQSCIHGFIEW